MKKSSLLYVVIICMWLLLLGIAIWPLVGEVQRATTAGWRVSAMVILSTVFIAYFWLNGVKDLVYTAYYYLRRKQLLVLPPAQYWRQTKGRLNPPRVVMVYCTANDFSASSLLASMQQKYPNFETVILDDSNKEAYKKAVNDFASQNNLKVVRRPDRAGFKAGNLNNYLQKADYDYFVILDSDEIVPPNFIARCLDYFAFYSNAGIIQANHVATRNRNKFMSLFAVGVDSHWLTYQAVKHHHGFLSLLGHGAMVSRECYLAAGGFPHLVAEDLCFSIESRKQGFFTAFAADVVCEEEYPVSYLAFKKRHSKWTQGNMEFIKKYTGRIVMSEMTWFEKLDIFLFTYNLPLTVFFSLYVVINVIILPMLSYHIQYPVWMLAPTLLFLLAPMFNDIIYLFNKKNPLQLAWYLVHTVFLYGSMFFISLMSSAKSIFGKSTFLVTPKEQSAISIKYALTSNWGEIMFSVLLLGISVVCDGSPLPTLMIVIPGFFSVYLTLMSNSVILATERAEPVLTEDALFPS
ncbi:MAG TPA: glycosyltransferase family 2 protein [Patescibacteria group bacterium]|jgi:cellulose synthase/poly-beta-1,6-N-acetylglucosamine synthase-like glycosyltransferase|nr:glycosyltransferase family 2 protein [Patescibacteria group bacterium]